MNTKKRIAGLSYWTPALLLLLAAAQALAAAPPLVQRQWKVDGIVRQALLHVPPDATKADTPVLFAFHGHGGTMRSAARNFAFHRYWPEALVVYMQGLPTPGLTDPQGKLPGWQKTATDQNGRDLQFFDAVLATLKKEYKVDQRRIFATGHSNGGAFTYLLWAERGQVLAAVAPSAAGMLRGIGNLKPKPALHLAGENDQLVPFAFQQRMMQAIRRLNGCEAEGVAWAKSGTLVGRMYPSKRGTPFVSLVYPGTHRFPPEAPPLIVRFFKESAKG